LYSKNNKDSLKDFTDRLVALKNDLIALLSQQAVLMLSTQTDTLSRIESRLAKSLEFYAAVSDESEDNASTFVASHGGVEAVEKVSAAFLFSILFIIIVGFRATTF
jgi:hypothetical protein